MVKYVELVKVNKMDKFGKCSELVGCTQLYFQTIKFGLHLGLDYDLW